MVETAFTMSIVLLVFLGMIKLAFVGYEQAQADGASFVAAHAAALATTAASGPGVGKAHAQNDFGIAQANVNINSTASGPNLNNDFRAEATLTSGGLFLNQGFGVPVFSLHSFIVEPQVQQSPQIIPLIPTVTLNTPQPLNCTTRNTGFTPVCPNLIPPAPKASPNTFDQYECRLAYLAVLTRSADVPASINAPSNATVVRNYPNAPSLAQHPWPKNWRPGSPDSINESGNRPDSGGYYFNKDDSAGTAVAPIMEFGKTTCL